MPKRPSLPRMYWVLWSCLLLNRAGGFVVIILALYLTTQRGQTESMAGLIVGLFGVGGAGGVLLGGMLADRFGRKSTMLISASVAAVALAALTFVTPLIVIGVIVGVFGFAMAMFSPPAIAAMADVVPPEDRDYAFNLMFWATNVGMGVATLAAGFLAKVSYELLFILNAAAEAIVAVVIVVAVRETLVRTPVVPESSTTPVARPGRFADVWRDRIYLTFVGLLLLQAIVFTQTQSTLPLAMTADGLSESDYGIALAIGSGMIILGQLLVPRLTNRFVKATVLAVSLAFMAVGFGAVGLVDSFGGYVVCVVVWTIGGMLGAPPNATVIADLSPAGMRGRYQSVFNLTFTLAAFIAPAIGGFTLQYLGDWHWLIIGCVAATATVGHLLSGPARERSTVERARAASIHINDTVAIKRPVPQLTASE
ncbi:MFS transporter [Stackebrandtia soli]|uniref:MFS transporter n=1 Tax=Stackebrandtia soli TaxID=1892856 RepID=UPI0039EC862B